MVGLTNLVHLHDRKNNKPSMLELKDILETGFRVKGTTPMKLMMKDPLQRLRN